ncbi:hypothetical protein GCM10009069_01810 [Algimonas arctica]|uniref:Lipoprotein n=1 Tax=Algimonas arctica TaxID=1479486 RepID=A0A8J3CNB4_9PROT|nr:hypothetical protein [Algimonas arctica]GHA82314.1 hypothetical protein GCM10009069_01810 [Algimonas arctica]
MSLRALFPVATMAALVALSACNRPSGDLTGTFETLLLATIENPGCVFRSAETPEDDEAVIFATYAGNLDYIAVTRFKGETIKLVPKEVPDMSTDTFDVTYEVIDYLRWQVRAVVDNGIGELRLIQNGEPTDIVSPMIGSCET